MSAKLVADAWAEPLSSRCKSPFDQPTFASAENVLLKRQLAQLSERVVQLESQLQEEPSKAVALAFLDRLGSGSTAAELDVPDDVAASFAPAFAELD